MSEVVRDPNGVFACPRCGRLVTYKGRGRRPVWCSAQCRVEASIERRGNRMVGIEPRVVRVIPPKQRVSEWEENERRRLQATLTEDAVSLMVAENPLLLVKVLERTERSTESGSDAQRAVVARRLRDTADAIAPDTSMPAGPAGVRVQHQSWKRSALEWATLLKELANQLANGQFYTRDLALIDEPLHLLAERYVRRRGA
jgi:hypothetical protein